MAGFIYVVGIGPGKEDGITKEAEKVLRQSDIIAGYKTYIDLVAKIKTCLVLHIIK